MIKKALAIAMLALLLGGCAKQNAENIAPANVKPQTKGQLTIAGVQEPNLLNPLMAENEASYEVGRMIYGGLVFCDDKGIWQPDLASEVPGAANGGISPDGRILTYKLRSGVTWHDGAPFTADDVKFTWQMIMSKKMKISRDGYDKISGIDVSGPNMLIIRFKEPYPGYLSLF